MAQPNNSQNQTPTEPRSYLCAVCAGTFQGSISFFRHERIHRQLGNDESGVVGEEVPEAVEEVAVEATTHPPVAVPHSRNAVRSPRAQPSVEAEPQQPVVQMPGARSAAGRTRSRPNIDLSSMSEGSSKKGKKEAKQNRAKKGRKAAKKGKKAVQPPAEPQAAEPQAAEPQAAEPQAAVPQAEIEVEQPGAPPKFDLNKLPDEQNL